MGKPSLVLVSIRLQLYQYIPVTHFSKSDHICTSLLWFCTEFPDIDNVDKTPTSMSYAEKKRVWELHKDIPMVCWKANMVLAWLEVECQMPMYSPMCYDNIKSGKVLLELNDTELEAGLGMGNIMHRGLQGALFCVSASVSSPLYMQISFSLVIKVIDRGILSLDQYAHFSYCSLNILY